MEGGETIGVTGASPGTQVTGTSVTLTDDDSYPAVTLSASPSSVSEGASAHVGDGDRDSPRRRWRSRAT